MAETNKECSTRQMASIVVATCLQKAIWGMYDNGASPRLCWREQTKPPGRARPGPAAGQPARPGRQPAQPARLARTPHSIRKNHKNKLKGICSQADQTRN